MIIETPKLKRKPTARDIFAAIGNFREQGIPDDLLIRCLRKAADRIQLNVAERYYAQWGERMQAAEAVANGGDENAV
jgi:hypothetical protein